MKLPKPRIQPVQKNELTSEQRDLLDQLGQSGRLNVFRTLIRYPKLFQRFLVFGRYVLEESTLASRDRELLILRTACLCRAEYEWSHHVISGKEVGLTDREILRIIKGPNAKGWSSFDAALLRAVDELHEDMFISDSTWDALAKRYTEQQLVDLVFTVGMYSHVSMVLNSIGVQLDEGVAGFPKQDSVRVD
jgi:4-carboxymuconolactone decarboxylase